MNAGVLPPIEGPRIGRHVAQQIVVVCAAGLALSLLPARPAPPVPHVQPKPALPPPPKEKIIRVVAIPKPPPPAQKPPPVKEPTPKPTTPPPPAPKAAPPKPAPPKPAPPQPQAPAMKPPPPSPMAQHIPTETTHVSNVPMRVRIPSTLAGLEAHFRNSGGCLAVSDDDNNLVAAYGLTQGQVVGVDPSVCGTVPRRLIGPMVHQFDPALDAARARSGGKHLELQLLLNGSLVSIAKNALQQKYGALDTAEMGRRAEAEGYTLLCTAWPDSGFECH